MENKEITKEQIEMWKKKHGDKNVFLFEIPIDDTGKKNAIGYFRKPDLQVIGIASKFIDTDPIKSGVVLFDNCWLGGDELIKENDELKMSAIESLNGIFRVRQASIKNL